MRPKELLYFLFFLHSLYWRKKAGPLHFLSKKECSMLYFIIMLLAPLASEMELSGSHRTIYMSHKKISQKAKFKSFIEQACLVKMVQY